MDFKNFIQIRILLQAVYEGSADQMGAEDPPCIKIGYSSRRAPGPEGSSGHVLRWGMFRHCIEIRDRVFR